MPYAIYRVLRKKKPPKQNRCLRGMQAATVPHKLATQNANLHAAGRWK